MYNTRGHLITAEMAAEYLCVSRLVSFDCLARPLTDRALPDAAGTWKACNYVTTRCEH